MDNCFFSGLRRPARLGIRQYTRILVRQIQYDRLDPIWGKTWIALRHWSGALSERGEAKPEFNKTPGAKFH